MLYLTVINERQNRKFTHASGPLVMGRAPNEECDSFSIVDRFVSRDQLRIEELPKGRLKIINRGATLSLVDPNGNLLSTLEKDEVRDVDLPVEVNAGYTKIHIKSDAVRADDSFRTISRLTKRDKTPSSLQTLGQAPSATTLAVWFETLLSVQRAAAGSDAFYTETARAVVELVGLDVGLVVLFGANKLEIKAQFSRQENYELRVSRTVLAQISEKKCTFYQSMPSGLQGESLYEVEAVVASPIFDRNDQVVGAVYGSRDLRRDAKGKGIEPLEAQIIQLLAGAVTAGLARVHEEVEAARLRVQFEQFFSPQLSAELERNPRLLDGAELEISVLFADVRGYTRIAERLGTKESFRLIGDVMDRLTNRILEHGGVIIDYYGDGFAAMWNAPADQPNHVHQACQAALGLQAEMPLGNEQWAVDAGEPLRLGVGIHTGMAQVGNAGSQRRIKYGPRGHTVNLASRIEGTTKQFGVPIVISQATQSRLGESFVTRRLRKVRLVNIDAPVEVFELKGATAEPDWLQLRSVYEKSLIQFEMGRLEMTKRLLLTLSDVSADVPSHLLLKNASSPDEPFDPVLRLDRK